jgi:hypothetical protein
MIDCGATHNFISQIKVKELNLKGTGAVPPGLKQLDGTPLQAYEAHSLDIGVKDHESREKRAIYTMIGVNMTGIDMILGLPWLEEENPDIDWPTRRLRWRSEGEGAGDEEVTASHASEDKIATSRDEGPTKSIDIAIVDRDEFNEICRYENVQACTFEYEEIVQVLDRERSVAGAVTETENEHKLPEKYQDFADVFDKANADKLPEHGPQDHAIETIEGKSPPFGPIYNLSVTELETLREYLDEHLKKGFITPSHSPAGAPILFVKKPGGGLRLCVDYRGLNAITIKNRYPIPLIMQILTCLMGAVIFTKLDIRAAYYAIRIREGDEWKTAFRCRYGHFEYRVMPFGLANAPASFQAYINMALREFIDIFVIVYLDDILIFSKNQADHVKHVRLVLEKLRLYRLFCALHKCKFDMKEVDYLGYMVDPLGLRMDPARIATITEWPVPKSHREVQVFIGFANFYRRFIRYFSRIAAGLTNLLKEGKKGKFTQKFVLTSEAKKAFEELKRAFTSAPMLMHFDPKRKILIETDASGYALSGVISQWYEGEDRWHPVAFYSRKMTSAERNYITGEAEMLAIVEACRQWRQFVEGAQHTVRVITDHCNLRTFLLNKTLSRKEARWWEKLSGLDLSIEYRPGRSNPADGPSRRPDYMDEEALHVNQLILRNDGSSNQLRDGNRGSGGQPAVPGPVEEVSQAPLLSETFDGLRNDPINTQNSGSIAPRAHVGLTVRTRALPSSSTGAPVSAANNASQERPGGRPPGVRKHHEGQKRAFRLVKKENDVSRQEIVAVVSQDIDIADPPVELRTILKILQESDQLAQEKWLHAATSAPEERGTGGGTEDGRKVNNNRWHIKDDLLHYEGKYYIPPGRLRRELLKQNHDDPQAGHFGYDKTLELLRRKYYWPLMPADVREYTGSCSKCLQSKPTRHKPYGLLESLPVAEGPRRHWTMDFITDLPPSRYRGLVYDAILVMVDRFTKYSRYIPARKDWDAEFLGDVLFDEIFSKLGMPLSLVSDRGSLFTSKYWSDFCYHLRVKVRLSTAYHPQTDGQTERQNQTLEQYLRCYVDYQQDNWAQLLSVAEYAYNNSCHSVIKMSPFEAIYGEAPRWEDFQEREGAEVPAARNRTLDLTRFRDILSQRLEEARQTQAKYYDQKHIPHTYKVGDKVLLNAKNIKTTRPSKKLDHKYIGPFEVLLPIGKQAYRLRLPTSYGSIHNVFHVSLLEPFKARSGEPPAPLPVLVEDEEHYEIESILDSRIWHKKLQYFVKWLGWPDAENQWISPQEIRADELIEEFHRKYPRKPGGSEAIRPAKRLRSG